MAAKRPRRKLLVDVADLQVEIMAAEGAPTDPGALPPSEVGRAMAVAFDNWCRRKDADEKAKRIGQRKNMQNSE